MKKAVAIIVLVLITCLIVVTPVTAFANSAQRKFFGVSSSGALITTENCPVTVKAERLTFNINSYPSLDNGVLANYNANVAAEYDFYNPADYDVNMQLVFPFGRIPDYVYYYDDFNDNNKYSVYVNDVKVERGIRAIYNEYSQFDLSRDLSKISDEPILYNNLPDDTLVYKYTVKNTFERYNHEYTDTYVADFDYSGKTLFLSTEENYRIDYPKDNNLRVYSNKEFYLYSVGQPLEDSFFSANYYAILYDNDRRSTLKMVSGSTSFVLDTLSLEDFLLTYYNAESGVTALDYRNAVVTYLHSHSKMPSRIMNLTYLDVTDHLTYWYQYDVSIPAGQTVTNKVVAPLYPDIDMYYSPSKYSYEYLLSPASSWADFSNLDIKIYTNYFMSNPSLEGFEKIDGGYSAHFDKLPQGELTFDLCEAENPERQSDNWSGLFVLYLLLLPAMILMSVVYGVSALAIIIITLYVLWVIAAAITIPLVLKRDKRRLQQRRANNEDNAEVSAEQSLSQPVEDDVVAEQTDDNKDDIIF